MSRRKGDEKKSTGVVGPVSESQFLLNRTEDGRQRIEVRLEGETVWLTLGQMAELFQIDKSGISRHLKNIYDTGELQSVATVADSATVRQEGYREVQRVLEQLFSDQDHERAVEDWCVTRAHVRPSGDVPPERRP